MTHVNLMGLLLASRSGEGCGVAHAHGLGKKLWALGILRILEMMKKIQLIQLVVVWELKAMNPLPE